MRSRQNISYRTSRSVFDIALGRFKLRLFEKTLRAERKRDASSMRSASHTSSMIGFCFAYVQA